MLCYFGSSIKYNLSYLWYVILFGVILKNVQMGWDGEWECLVYSSFWFSWIFLQQLGRKHYHVGDIQDNIRQDSTLKAGILPAYPSAQQTGILNSQRSTGMTPRHSRHASAQPLT